MKIKALDVDFVVMANKKVCHLHGHKHICAHPERIQSALHSAIYPGHFPFIHGGVIEIGAAMFFYIIKAHVFFDGNKRTALICAVVFIESNGWSLKYPISSTRNDFAQLADDCAANVVNLDGIKEWFRSHKVKIRNLK